MLTAVMLNLRTEAEDKESLDSVGAKDCEAD
jgi:hypothetical protein